MRRISVDGCTEWSCTYHGPEIRRLAATTGPIPEYAHEYMGPEVGWVRGTLEQWAA